MSVLLYTYERRDGASRGHKLRASLDRLTNAFLTARYYAIYSLRFTNHFHYIYDNTGPAMYFIALIQSSQTCL